MTGVREGQPARAAGANLTIIVQGTDRIFGTLGDSRCTVDSLTQRPLKTPGTYRVEARGFCTQPAHAVRGDGAVLVSTFEFAGPVNYAAARKRRPNQSSAEDLNVPCLRRDGLPARGSRAGGRTDLRLRGRCIPIPTIPPLSRRDSSI